VRIAFQGVHGAYSEEAARALFGKGTQTLPCESFGQVFRAVTEGKAQRAIIPIENSLAGSIHENYDLLLSHRLHIVAETHVRIEHALIGHHVATLKQLREVRSHPQALAQCSTFFDLHPQIRAVPFFDTAGAAQSLATEAQPHIGAIASALAAQIFGLKVLKRNIENRLNNFTRFLALSRAPWHPQHGVQAKTSIVFKPARNRVGVLFRALGVFALRDIDLLKIESRPDPASPFTYLFYLDLAGSPGDDQVSRALEHLREMVAEFRLLGVYPRQKV
jgi:prephenate dehydratase